MVRPGTRSMACSPVVLSSLNTRRQYTSGPSLSEGQRLEHRLRLVLGLRELARRIGVRHDPRACLYHHSILERSEEHTSELQSRPHLVCRLLLEKKKNNRI